MSISGYILGLNENNRYHRDDINIVDESGFNEDTVFGVDKLDIPKDSGIKAADNALDQFSKASDGKDTDVNVVFHDSFPEDKSGFNTTNNGIPSEEQKVDPNTIPAVNAEEDQFENFEDIENVENSKISDNELAEDDDFEDDTLNEMFDVNGYDDLI